MNSWGYMGVNANSEGGKNGVGFMSGGYENITEGVGILEGGMAYVPMGKARVLVAFGGFNTEVNDTRIKDFWMPHRSMDWISVYDVESETWFNVTAQGAIPPVNSRF
ncbi:MAG: hypothetical protein M1837_002128 [Sclerophora amabilis]|nr:MAG: hypothetical protein M1837_002128 [Sclerophora amabilis]